MLKTSGVSLRKRTEWRTFSAFIPFSHGVYQNLELMDSTLKAIPDLDVCADCLTCPQHKKTAGVDNILKFDYEL